jgi:hypothetical protein
LKPSCIYIYIYIFFLSLSGEFTPNGQEMKQIDERGDWYEVSCSATSGCEPTAMRLFGGALPESSSQLYKDVNFTCTIRYDGSRLYVCPLSVCVSPVCLSACVSPVCLCVPSLPVNLCVPCLYVCPLYVCVSLSVYMSPVSLTRSPRATCNHCLSVCPLSVSVG